MPSALLSHSMAPDDLECPQNWPRHRKLWTSFACWCMSFAVAYGLTSYTAGMDQIVAAFDLNPSGSKSYIPLEPIALFSLYIWGIAFAPIYTPHVAERTGRSVIYLITVPICGLFLLGAGFSQSFASLAVCRFFAGVFAGPTLVLLEGTFADIWSAETTNTYYAFQLLPQFFGTGCGPLVGGYLVHATGGWRWTEWFAAILSGAASLIALGISETYQREIPRRRAKRTGQTLHQEPALSGVTLSQMAKVTVLDPMIQVVSDPVTIMATLFLVFYFAVTLQFFFTVPVALGAAPPMGPGYSITQVGLAFTTALAGAAIGAAVIIFTEHVFALRIMRQNKDWMSIEYRLLPEFLGCILVTAALFWIGKSLFSPLAHLIHLADLSLPGSTVANPSFSPLVPICGTAVFVIGSYCNIGTMIPYLFDVYAPAGTLSAITTAACGRLLVAGALPLVILQFVTNATPKWTFYTFGIISILFWAVPAVLFMYGAKMRQKSRWAKGEGMTGAWGQEKGTGADLEGMRSGSS